MIEAVVRCHERKLFRVTKCTGETNLKREKCPPPNSAQTDPTPKFGKIYDFAQFLHYLIRIKREIETVSQAYCFKLTEENFYYRKWPETMNIYRLPMLF